MMSEISRPSEGSLPPPGRSLAEAVITALILLGLIVLFNVLGANAFFFLAAAVVGIAQFELYDGLTQTGRAPATWFGLACGIALMAAAFLQRPGWVIAVIALAAYGSLLISLRRTRGATPASDAAWTFLGVGWVAGGGAAAVAMLQLSEDGPLVLTAFILITALDDIGGYFAGSRFGRRKLAPSISPAKSWEGLAGGIAASLAGGALFGFLLHDLTIAEGLGLALIASVLAPVGDLVESLTKREIGIKDSGRLLPGHGGLLDRLDAIVFCAPVAYLYLRLVVF